MNPRIVTISNATPAVITLTNHGLIAGNTIMFTTTGSLPTGLAVNTLYYVMTQGLTASTFQVATSLANSIYGIAVNTSSAGSGTQTLLIETENAVQLNQDYQFITDMRILATNFINVINTYTSLYQDYQDIYLVNTRLQDNSFINANAGILKQDFANAIAGFQAVTTALNANSNYARLMIQNIKNQS